MTTIYIVRGAGSRIVTTGTDLAAVTQDAQGIADLVERDNNGATTHYVIEAWTGSDMQDTGVHVYGKRAPRVGAVVTVPSVEGETVRGIVVDTWHNARGRVLALVAIVEADGETSALVNHFVSDITVYSLHTPRHKDTDKICGRAIYVGDCPLGHNYR